MHRVSILFIFLTLLSGVDSLSPFVNLLGKTQEELMEFMKKSNLLRVNDLVEEDVDHLQEHMKDADIDLHHTSKEQKEFFYFKSHDVNEDNTLDGLELLRALEHTFISRKHNTENLYDVTQEDGKRRYSKLKESIIVNVDLILQDDDTDDDGCIDYTEFSQSRRGFSLSL